MRSGTSVAAVPAWFAEVDLDSASPAARSVFMEVCRLLDKLQPSRLAPERQTARVEDGEIWVRLVHAVDRYADLDLAVGEHTSHIYGLGGHDEAYSTAADPDEAWQAETIEILDALLRGRYRIEQSWLRGRPYRTRVVDLIGDARNATVIESTLGFLPLPSRILTAASLEIDYGCGELATL